MWKSVAEKHQRNWDLQRNLYNQDYTPGNHQTILTSYVFLEYILTPERLSTTLNRCLLYLVEFGNQPMLF